MRSFLFMLISAPIKLTLAFARCDLVLNDQAMRVMSPAFRTMYSSCPLLRPPPSSAS
ncbi:MAG: hypothetical protein H6643_12835 [Caldilineaceae bacterium]|nr:hypothetical protein [Caldilineaceae bacterium]